uniref:neuromedin-U receptor 2-like n=1 Tax=Myxine glutinosa TaxID=7769 RepID=UPI00358F523E
MNDTSPLANVSARWIPDESLQEYLAWKFGDRTSEFFTPICIIYTLIFTLGTGGNVLTCTVIARKRSLNHPINFYLFSLAVSDLMLLVLGMPLELYEMWSNYPFLFGRLGCYISTSLFETVCLASILNVNTLSFERYIAVMQPLRARSQGTRGRALRLIAALWLAAAILSLPVTATHGLHVSSFPNGSRIEESAVCTVVIPLWIYKSIMKATALLFYVLPMFMLTILYCKMGFKLRGANVHKLLLKTQMQGSQGPYSVARSIHSPHHPVSKMLAVLVLVFGLCWAPFHIDRLFYSFVNTWTESLAFYYNTLHVVSGVFFYLSSAVNPIIYNAFSTRFRAAFHELICRHECTRTSQLSRSSVYSLPIFPAKCIPTSHSLGTTDSSGNTHSSVL